MLLTGRFLQIAWLGIPWTAIVVFLGTIVAITVYLFTKFEEIPKYHSVFGYLGFVVSVAWIYGMANEVVDLLQAIGIMLDLSDAILGLTVLAWGNSLGDLIANVSMARQGFPRMGISACFGGPLLNLLLGIGLPYTILLASNGESLPLEYSRMVTLLYSTITLSLISTVLILLVNNFETKRYHGLFLITVYMTYVILAILIEMDIL
jgi:sodium/potassium/calcium exchanger 6